MKKSVLFQRVENAVIAVLVVVAFVNLDFDWLWLLVTFVLFDISMVGYAISKTVGAFGYNLVHNYAGPATLLALFFANDARAVAFVGLCWAFHVAGDRAQGYGLKEDRGFKFTHLGEIGKKSQR